ncbi:MAG: hypothetical protein GQ565_05030, partial [Candidatus Aegiribacteria sp.]|nr:hypothetical protein [Candidatus Aegiribacteria sp.]
MKAISLSIALCCILFSFVFAIPWPLGDGATGWESIFPITRTYGNFDENAFWVYVNSTFDEHNFHNAIDISLEDAGTENIRAVEAGVFEDCRPTNTDSTEWFAQIFPVDSTYGWHYGHVQGDDGYPLRLDAVRPGVDIALYGDLLGTMAEISGKHLHFFRTDQHMFQNGIPGVDNPLDYLDSIPSGVNNYTWEILTSDPAVFFLPQRDAIYGSESWTVFYDPPTPGYVNPSAVLGDTLDRNHLLGSVDVMHGCFVKGYPQGTSVDRSGIPQKIKWTLFRVLNTGIEEQFRKYVVDFDGEVGAAPGHWQEFRRFYFPFFANQLGWFGPGADAPIVCLTNCGDAAGWDGINNIEENCWQTNSDNQFSGTTTNPVLAAFPDGPYKIDVMSYAWDTTETHGDTLDIELHNFSPVVEKVVISCGGRTIWEAYWTADGLTPKWNNPSDQGVLPDQQLDV